MWAAPDVVLWVFVDGSIKEFIGAGADGARRQSRLASAHFFSITWEAPEIETVFFAGLP